MKTVCIYHGECMDGAASAAVVRHKFPDAKLIPAQHGEPIPELPRGCRVVVVDFSFPVEIFKKIREQAAEVLWFDHHKTALPIRDALGFGVLDLKESGATLTWKQLFPKKPLPKVLGYVRDKDLWLWKLPKSREISADLRETDSILDPKNKIWKNFFTKSWTKEQKKMVERGERSRRLLRDRMVKAASRGFAIDLDGHKAFAVNWTEDTSDLGEYIYKELKYPIALIYSHNGKAWTFSMRSKEVDVSELAVRRGGGGHPGASGFRMNDIDWLFQKKIS